MYFIIDTQEIYKGNTRFGQDLSWGSLETYVNYNFYVQNDSTGDTVLVSSGSVPKDTEVVLDASSYNGEVVKWTIETSEGTKRLSYTDKLASIVIDSDSEIILYLE